MKNITINISLPGEILLTLRESDKELALNMKRWTALKLFEEKRLSIGQCSELAEMSEEDFIKYLGTNKITVFPYSNREEIREDLNNA